MQSLYHGDVRTGVVYWKHGITTSYTVDAWVRDETKTWDKKKANGQIGAGWTQSYGETTTADGVKARTVVTDYGRAGRDFRLIYDLPDGSVAVAIANATDTSTVGVMSDWFDKYDEALAVIHTLHIVKGVDASSMIRRRVPGMWAPDGRYELWTFNEDGTVLAGSTTGKWDVVADQIRLYFPPNARLGNGTMPLPVRAKLRSPDVMEFYASENASSTKIDALALRAAAP